MSIYYHLQLTVANSLLLCRLFLADAGIKATSRDFLAFVHFNALIKFLNIIGDPQYLLTYHTAGLTYCCRGMLSPTLIHQHCLSKWFLCECCLCLGVPSRGLSEAQWRGSLISITDVTEIRGEEARKITKKGSKALSVGMSSLKHI